MANSDYEMTNESPEELLNRAVKNLEQESAGIQIQGRPLTPQEQTRVESIGKAVEIINQAIKVLAEG
jgi:hypothetical protein